MKNIVLCSSIFILSKCLDFILIRLSDFYLRKFFPKTTGKVGLEKRLSNGFLLFLFTLLNYLCLSSFDLNGRLFALAKHILLPLVIFSGTRILTQIMKVLGQLLKIHFDYSVPDNLRRRSIYTQIQFIEKTSVIAIWILSTVTVFSSFDGARQAGMSLLASASILSVVIGFAAQKSLASFLAGFQIAFTQPIRLDDVVIVEGQWGRIEEITLTYVVVCLWDLRRLVVPINYFIEKPFENWTRCSADILPYILINVDYGLPLKALKEKFLTLVNESKLWNKKVAIMQVVDCTENTMVVRGLMSADNASIAFDLKCEIREKLIEFIQETYPSFLPKTRITVHPGREHPFEGAPNIPFSDRAPN